MTNTIGSPPYLKISDPPRLVGGRSRRSGQYFFPVTDPVVRDGDVEPVELHPVGRIWSYTVQRFRPKSPPYDGPEDFEPYIVVMVALPDQLIVESRLVGVALEDVRIGLPVELTLLELKSHDGGSRLSHAFRPINGDLT